MAHSRTPSARMSWWVSCRRSTWRSLCAVITHSNFSFFHLVLPFITTARSTDAGSWFSSGCSRRTAVLHIGLVSSRNRNESESCIGSGKPAHQISCASRMAKVRRPIPGGPVIRYAWAIRSRRSEPCIARTATLLPRKPQFTN